MRTIVARRVLPGAAVAEAETLWLDLGRWVGFVDGFASIARVQGEWPQAGARVVWHSRPGGRGLVAEQVLAHEPRARHEVRVEDPKLRGTQTATFAAVGSGCELALELAYELKEPGPGGPLTDLFFVRPALRESLRRTLDRFAIELQADRELT